MQRLKIMDEIKKSYYSVRQVADVIAVSTATVINFCKDYGIEPKRDKRGAFRFSEDQLLIMKQIAQVNRMNRVELVKKIIVTDFPRTAANLMSA